MSRSVLLVFCLSAIMLLLACSKAENSNSNMPAASSNNPATSASSPATTRPAATPSGDRVGIAACDDFLVKYDACVADKVPPTARAQYQETLVQWRESWKKMAGNPATRASLEMACKTAMEQARTQMQSFNCNF